MINQSPAISSITFFYPSRIVGGAEFLYIRLAKYIAETTTIPVYVFDYSDGFLRSNLKGTTVKVLDYLEENKVVVDFDTIIITPLCHIFKVNEFSVINNSGRVFFWSIHPTHFTNYFLNRAWFLRKKDVKIIKHEFINLIDNGAIAFMDYPNYIENRSKLGLPYPKQSLNYLPICCDDYKGILHHNKENETINVCWLGRIASDKVASIENFAWHLQQLPEQIRKRINFIIIGNGEEESRMYQFLSNLGIRYEHKHTILGNQLNSFLVDNVDIGVAMGTSLLEFAKLRIPIVKVDIMPSDKLIKNNKFNWLYETDGYSMGNIFDISVEYNHTINDIFLQVSTPEKYNSIASLCFDYYLNNHSLSIITTKLLSMANNTSIKLPNKSVSKITKIMNPWYFKAIKKVKNKF